MNLSYSRYLIFLILFLTIISALYYSNILIDTVTAQVMADGNTGSVSVYDKAVKMYRTGEFREAIRLLEQKRPIDAGSRNLLGWAYLKTGEADEAVRQFNLSISLDPSSYDSYCGLGFSHIRSGRLSDALYSFEKGTSEKSSNIECLLGKAGVLERLNEKERAADVYKRVLSLDKDNRTARVKVAGSASDQVNDVREDLKFFARGDYFWIRLKNETRPFFVKGINLGFGLPGKYPTEFPEETDTYLEWFRLVKEMNANVIRIYTILPPQFYKALRQFNQERKGEDNLFLMQGIWVELPEGDDFNAQGFRDEVLKEIRNAVDVLHGDAVIPHRYGHAHGTYTENVAAYTAGIIFGREWEPPAARAFNGAGRINSFSGKYLSISASSPIEAWLTEMLNYVISYEAERYKSTRPVALMNWPPLDPLFHESEATLQEETEFRRKSGERIPEIDYTHAFDEDAIVIDETKIKISPNYKSGLFASYHVYPYYPDFLRNDKAYGRAAPVKGSGYYYNYIHELKTYYRDMPLLISEFGVPTSRGVARFQPDGMHHGGHNEYEQGEILQRLFTAIRQAGTAGGIAFAFADEWFKTNWMVRGMEEDGRLWFNAQDPEESYGIIAMNPAGVDKLKGRPQAWAAASLLYSDDSKSPLKVMNDNADGARNIKGVYADYDAGYFYIRLDIDGTIDWSSTAYLIAIDTFGDEEGEHILPFNLDLESPIGFEFVVLLHGERSSILIDNKYNRMEFDKSLQRLPGLSGYRENRDFRPVPDKDGLFTEMVTIHRRRFSRGGKVFPERVYNASALRQGSSDEDSLADYYYSEKNRFIEIRLPWNLIYFANPSAGKIIYSMDENKITSGIRLMAASYRPHSSDDSTALKLAGDNNITDMLPSSLSDMKGYTWKGWQSPEYTVRPKRSYQALKEIYGKEGDPALIVRPPEGFEFTPVVESHYESFDSFLDLYNTEVSMHIDPYGLALANLVRGLAGNSTYHILEARSQFAESYSGGLKKDESNFLPLRNRVGTGISGERVIMASKSGMSYTDQILKGQYAKKSNGKEKLARIKIKKYPPGKKDISRIIIGRSAITVKKETTIAAQTDRVTRDWLSGINYMKAPWSFSKEDVVGWHEGEKIRELVELADAKIHPVWGTIVRKFGDNWYAPDADGIYRFEISSDKVYSYPSNLFIDEGSVVLNDTHGISAIAWDSLNSDLAVGCGDYVGKVEAAYYLAGKGVNVYMPTDRFLSKLIGTRTKGVIIGSAPVKKISGGAIIGDQPIAIDVHEKIVVSNSAGRYPLQYYDTPYLYFKELQKYSGMKLGIIPVDIDEYGKSERVVNEARRHGTKLIGIRVAVKEEHDSVYEWLSEDTDNRAVLFHSAVYPEGYKLFFEFPGQTTFGDVNVYFE